MPISTGPLSSSPSVSKCRWRQAPARKHSVRCWAVRQNQLPDQPLALGVSLPRVVQESHVNRPRSQRSGISSFRRWMTCRFRRMYTCFGQNQGATRAAGTHFDVEYTPRFWTLFGPYAPARWSPLRTGPTRQINHLGRSGPRRNASDPLEVGV